jgi:multidrug resistance efflux pump
MFGLKPVGGASQSEHDRAKSTLEQTTNQWKSAKIKVEMQKKGGWHKDLVVLEKKLEQAKTNYEKLKATEYEVRQNAKYQFEDAQAKLAEINVNLKEAIVRAAEPAIVEVVAVRKGDLVTANQPIIRVLRAKDMWVKIFVPETELGKLRLHQKVEVQIDAYPGRQFQGEVFQIGTISEFTPRNVQSVEERHYQLFPVKIRVDDPEGVFRAGMAATVLVPLAPAP